MNPNTPQLDYTGERMVPETAAARTFWEHVGRYRFAAPYARDRRVLDVACGEGYGLAALAQAGAKQAIGIDISPETCAHAQAKYGVDARVGSAEALPLENQSVDLIVSFETLEHLEHPAVFLAECHRVLTPEGVLIISTPNRPVYQQQESANPFHHREFDLQEFIDLLSPQFQSIEIHSQCPRTAPWTSSRSLAAEQSPWLKIKGFWRLCSWICPERKNSVNEFVRSEPINQILNPKSNHTLARLVNPYQVQPTIPNEQPWYWIAKATPIRVFT